MIDLRVNEAQLKRTTGRAREKGIVVPTFREMRDPSLVPAKESRSGFGDVGLWDLHPQNLFRITWKNEPKAKGGLFGPVNTLEFPPELTGVDARIIALVGKWFPTGSHKVGATFGLSRPPSRHGAVRPDPRQGGVAFHRELLPRGRVQREPPGVRVDRDPSRGDVQGALPVAVPRSPAR